MLFILKKKQQYTCTIGTDIEQMYSPFLASYSRHFMAHIVCLQNTDDFFIISFSIRSIIVSKKGVRSSREMQNLRDSEQTSLFLAEI